MKKLYLASVAIALAASSTASFGIDAGQFYVTGGIQQMNIDIDTSGTTGATTDEDDTGFNLGVGYKVNDFFSVEGGYMDLGKASATLSAGGSALGLSMTAGSVTAEADYDAVYLGGVFEYGINDKLSLNAKGGLYWWDADYRATYSSATFRLNSYTYVVTNGTTTWSDDGDDIYYGLGATYNLSDNLQVRADWYRSDTDDGDVDVLGLNLVTSF